MSDRDRPAALIILITILLAATIIFYAGYRAHAADGDGPYYVLIDVTLPDLGLPDEPEDDFEKRPLPSAPKLGHHPRSYLIRTLTYLLAPPFADHAVCDMFVHNDKTFMKRIKMLFDYEKQIEGPKVRLGLYCGARVD